METFLDEQIQAATERAYQYMQQDFSPNLAQTVALQGSGKLYLELPYFIAGLGLDVGTLVYTIGVVKKQDLGSAVAAVVVDAGKLRHQQGTRRIYNDDGWDDNSMYTITYTSPNIVCPRIVKATVMRLAAYYCSESRQTFGSLGRATDYSTVVGESQVKFEDPEQRILSALDPYINRAA